MGTATTVDEAVALERGGVDVIVATGMEAAGHRVSFLRAPEESLVGTFALIPQVADAVSVPVVAAGGIADRRGVRAAFALGASGVQVGTAFLATRQSAANDAHRRAIAEASADAIVLTRAMSGRLARGLPNRAIRAIEAGGVVAPFPVQNWLTGQFRAEAGRRGIGELQSLWLGQAAALARFTDARDGVRGARRRRSARRLTRSTAEGRRRTGRHALVRFRRRPRTTRRQPRRSPARRLTCVRTPPPSPRVVHAGRGRRGLCPAW